MNKYIFLIISFILDFVLLNIIPFNYYNISYFQPLFLIVSISLSYKLFNSDKQYFTTIFVISIFFGSLFMNNILFGIFSLLLVALITKLYNKYINLNNFTLLIEILFIIAIYDTFIYMVISLSIISTFSFNSLLYKFTHSIIINLVYAFFIYNFYIKKVLKIPYS